MLRRSLRWFAASSGGQSNTTTSFGRLPFLPPKAIPFAKSKLEARQLVASTYHGSHWFTLGVKTGEGNDDDDAAAGNLKMAEPQSQVFALLSLRGKF